MVPWTLDLESGEWRSQTLRTEESWREWREWRGWRGWRERLDSRESRVERERAMRVEREMEFETGGRRACRHESTSRVARQKRRPATQDQRAS